ncbi:putative peptidyl-tRNA hydrolase PTRHD1 [Daktulosphaira vitifoliae]|uniref:putative peptidyl-tRNA hydrolase PTRHD1 n=1 Tax=Daktulosphaira vitifoliae TaxID=58002 RepID=UPI0021A9BA3A|nr:putative peptidyl-tRNA hydrolase PTRHD1 [Daktulosphaira vitifoliae]
MTSLVQYVLIRGDLARSLKWPSGAVIAQACHACVAVTHTYYSDPDTQAYLRDLGNMHKVVLEVPDEPALLSVVEALNQDEVPHVVWKEQPENIATCVAIKPSVKGAVSKYVKKFKLYGV